uniref:leucine-rich repeat domain-containing protein n=1 Tax=Faecalibacterium sp. TaxID=1971605 RepID=UPI0040253A61
MKKRLLSLFLTFSMLLTFFPVGTVTVFASDSPMAYTDGSYQFILNADNTATITKYTGNEHRITIPAQVTQDAQTYPVSKIGDRVFCNYKCVLTSVQIPDTITEIGSNAFYNCTSLKSVTIQDNKPSCVKKIGRQAFMFCSVLSDISILDSVTEIGSESFHQCEKLDTVTIPEGVTSVADGTFSYCYSLHTVTLPDSVTAIEERAFTGTALTQIHIPANVAQIGTDAFSECFALSTITSDSESYPSIDNVLYEKAANGDYALIRYPSRRADSAFKIPNGVARIETHAFAGCARLERIAIPSSVTKISEYAFSNCTALNNIEYSGSRSQWNAIFTDSGLQNVPVAPGSIDVTVTSDIRTVTAKIDGSSVPINDGKFIVTIGKTVELTVSDPQYRDRYTWAGGSGTVSADNTTYTFVAGQDDTAVTLTTVEHTNYDTGDFTISGLADYSYGDNIDIRIEPKDTRITDYIVRYVRNAGTSNEEEFNEFPKDAGTYTLRIIQGDTVRIDIPEKITIHPVTITNDTFQNELAVTLPADAVEEEGNDHTATVTVRADSRLNALLQSDEIKLELVYLNDMGEEVVAPTKAGRYTVKIKIHSNSPNLLSAIVDGGTFEIRQKAAPIVPTADLYPLTIKNAAVLIEHDGEEIHAERNEIGDLVAKVPENASVTVTYISQSDAIAFDQWLVSGLDDSTDVKQNPLHFQMPAGEKGVTIEAMTKDASIEDGGSGILGTVMVIGAAAVLTWQGCRVGTELYLKRILPDGAAIPANATELAELMWDDAGKPAPAAALDTDATDAQKALTWAFENQLLPSNKTADASVSYWEVIQIWRKAQALKN